MHHKLLMFYGLLVITVSFVCVVYRGYLYRTSEDLGNRYTTGRDELLLHHHKDATNLALWYTALGIVLIEMGVQTRPPGPSHALLWVHLPLAFAFFSLLLVLRFWFTGLKSVHHATLGRTCAVCFAGVLGTGAAMIAT